MKRNAKSIVGYTIGAIDGEIGKVQRFFFDDKTWKVLYLVVETGNWLMGNEVLIATSALLSPDWEKGIFPIKLTKEQIKNGPGIDTEKPVSRQKEIKKQEFYLKANYWGGGFYAGGLPVSMFHAILKDGPESKEKKSHDNPHLRSTAKVDGYHIEASDGAIGDVVDFIINDYSWQIDFIVVDTGHWFPGKKVLVSPKWIREINYETSTVIINSSIARVKSSPDYNPDEVLIESYEAQLHNHYNAAGINRQ